MKREYTQIFSFILGFTFILSGVIFSFVNSYKEEKNNEIQEEADIIDEIIDVYEIFKNKTEEYSTKRDEINNDIADYTSYYSGMEERYEEMTEKLNEYEELVKEVEDAAYYLKNHCINKTYSNQDANGKCNAYIINFEKTVNSFVGDIEFLNSKIDEYNEWIVEENEDLKENEKYGELTSFIPNHYKDYVDVNSDGTYLGRNSD